MIIYLVQTHTHTSSTWPAPPWAGRSPNKLHSSQSPVVRSPPCGTQTKSSAHPRACDLGGSCSETSSGQGAAAPLRANPSREWLHDIPCFSTRQKSPQQSSGRWPDHNQGTKIINRRLDYESYLTMCTSEFFPCLNQENPPPPPKGLVPSR